MHSFDINDREAFRRRQEEDLKRWNDGTAGFRQRQPFRTGYESASHSEDEDECASDGLTASSVGREDVWRNSEGETLGDFGVDEDTDLYDEEDMPLGELIKRRQATFRT